MTGRPLARVATSQLRDTDLRPIVRLRRIIAAVEAGALPMIDDAAWLIAGVRRYQAARAAGMELHLDRALDLSGPARHGWWRDEPLAERNRLFRVVREQHCGGMTDAVAAKFILARLRRPASRVRKADEPVEWEQLRSAVVQSGRRLPSPKHLLKLI